MLLFDLLAVKADTLAPENSKVHLAVFNGQDHPIDVFRDGHFEAWQAWQSKRNFSRDYVVSLIRMMGSQDRWLFAGAWRPVSVAPHPKRSDHWLYETTPVPELAELAGRVVVGFRNPNRQNVTYGETVADKLEVLEIRARALSNLMFTGYSDVRLSKAELDRIVRKADPEWVAPLSAVSGIYVIADLSDGRLYVGSASARSRTGDTGIWARWRQYSENGHGGNEGLKQLLTEKGAEHAQHFQYAILEVLPPQADDEAVKTREGHWKRTLDSLAHGFNRNLEKDVKRGL